MVKHILILMRDQKLGVNDLSFVKVIFIVEMETSFILGIILAMASSLLSLRLIIFRDCIRLNLSILSMIY